MINKAALFAGAGLFLLAGRAFAKNNENEIGGTVEVIFQARGIRNNNPGNIEAGNDNWHGATGSDGRYLIFSAPVYGLRAISRILDTYANKYRLFNIDGIIRRWAPEHENDTESYISHVEKLVGKNRFEALDEMDRSLLIAAIVKHENGSQPYDWDLIGSAIEMART